MIQTKKGNQWHFGMKVHIGVDAEIGLIHTVQCTTSQGRRHCNAGRLFAPRRNDHLRRSGFDCFSSFL